MGNHLIVFLSGLPGEDNGKISNKFSQSNLKLIFMISVRKALFVFFSRSGMLCNELAKNGGNPCHVRRIEGLSFQSNYCKPPWVYTT